MKLSKFMAGVRGGLLGDAFGTPLKLKNKYELSKYGASGFELAMRRFPLQVGDESQQSLIVLRAVRLALARGKLSFFAGELESGLKWLSEVYETGKPRNQIKSLNHEWMTQLKGCNSNLVLDWKSIVLPNNKETNIYKCGALGCCYPLSLISNESQKLKALAILTSAFGAMQSSFVECAVYLKIIEDLGSGKTLTKTYLDDLSKYIYGLPVLGDQDKFKASQKSMYYLIKKTAKPNKEDKELQGFYSGEILALALRSILENGLDLEAAIQKSINIEGESDICGKITGELIGVANESSIAKSRQIRFLVDLKTIDKSYVELIKNPT